MTALAEIAAFTRLRGIDRDAHADSKMSHVFANRLDDAGKFVSEDDRRFDDRVADPSIEISMQIATADAASGDAHQNFVVAGRARMRNAFDANVARSTESSGQHVA